MNIYYYKVIGIDIPLFWKTILKLAVFPAGMMAVGLLIMRWMSFDNWVSFFAAVAVYSLIDCCGMYFLNMNDYEKNVIREPLKKFGSKLTHK